MTCKLYLVPEDVINSWRSEQREKAVDRPTSTFAAQIDTKMDSILRKNISDYDKEKLFSQELEKYRTLRQQNPTPILAAATAAPSAGEANISLSSIPKMYQRKAEGLLQYLKSAADVSWDERGQLKIGDQIVDNSHILDLIHDAVRYRKQSKRPSGWRELSAYLGRSNVPRELVGNPAWISKDIKGTESSEDPVTPSSSEFDSYTSDGEFTDAAEDPAVKKFTPKQESPKPRASKLKGKQKIKKWITLEGKESN